MPKPTFGRQVDQTVAIVKLLAEFQLPEKKMRESHLKQKLSINQSVRSSSFRVFNCSDVEKP